MSSYPASALPMVALSIIVHDSLLILEVFITRVHIYKLPTGWMMHRFEHLRNSLLNGNGTLHRIMQVLLPVWRSWPKGLRPYAHEVGPDDCQPSMIIAVCRTMLGHLFDMVNDIPERYPQPTTTWLKPLFAQPFASALADASRSMILDSHYALQQCKTGHCPDRTSTAELADLADGSITSRSPILSMLATFVEQTSLLPEPEEHGTLRAHNSPDCARRGAAAVREAIIELGVSLSDRDGVILDKITQEAIALWYTAERILEGLPVCRALPCLGDQKSLRRCGRCRQKDMLYCSVECQRSHWPRHRAWCRPPNE